MKDKLGLALVDFVEWSLEHVVEPGLDWLSKQERFCKAFDAVAERVLFLLMCHRDWYK